MPVTKEYREMHPIELPPELKIRRGNEQIIRIQARGTTSLSPAIDFACETTLFSGRIRRDMISFSGEEFGQVFEYLKKAKRHWEE
jgi:hypothetical protein